MSGRIFLDTNVLVYAYSAFEPVKQAQALVASNSGERWISTQVLIEFVNVSQRKLKASWPDIQTTLIEITSNNQVIATSTVTIAHATRLAHRYDFSWFDSLIVAAALECGCETLYSEDLQHGQVIEQTLRVVNPFLP
ncbi:PIN domain-containing protein [Hymenobacter sp. ASUV-10]|uniref:PIN domain-containing protein n=1 Tax=Hymenobacter aranciens TaxID=3063996 RepID=A0ABT9BDI3_9BACT|nr:PIN domain-containing protein [Hymenobacter sp. ASUV-10]MDO7876321.1 PIN domain-containing protein [Hymenobacter sp. ASUV-10]